MQEHHKDLLAGAVLVLFLVATLLGGWLLLRLVH
jgi:diacylglycerol kinase